MIVIPLIEIDTTELEQIFKINEECVEVRLAHDMNESLERQLEEHFDLIQATLTSMYKIATPLEIEKASAKHFAKIRGRKHKIVGMWEVNKL